MKDVIVSFSSKGRDDYNRSLLRLIDSCIEHWKGDLLIYSPDHELSEYRGVKIHKGWPDPVGVKSYTHAEMPYQFKTALIQKALELGYERIIWLDSSMQLKKDLTPLFDHESGITTFHNLGHDTWKYLNNEADVKLDLFRSATNLHYPLMSIPQIWGGAFALNFTIENARLMFDWIKEYSVNGSFKNSVNPIQYELPGFVAHRHDQSVMSVLLYKNCQMLPYGQILCPPHDRTGEYGTDPYLVCRGL